MYIQHKLIKNLHLHRFKHTIYYYNFILFIYTPLHNLIDIAHLNIKLTIINYNFNRRKLDYIKLPHFQKDPKNLILSSDCILYDFKNKKIIQSQPKYHIIPSIVKYRSVKGWIYNDILEDLLYFTKKSLTNKNESKYFEITLSGINEYNNLFWSMKDYVKTHISINFKNIMFNTRLIICRNYNPNYKIAQIVVHYGDSKILASDFKYFFQHLHDLIFNYEN